MNSKKLKSLKSDDIYVVNVNDLKKGYFGARDKKPWAVIIYPDCSEGTAEIIKKELLKTIF